MLHPFEEGAIDDTIGRACSRMSLIFEPVCRHCGNPLPTEPEEDDEKKRKKDRKQRIQVRVLAKL